MKKILLISLVIAFSLSQKAFSQAIPFEEFEHYTISLSESPVAVSEDEWFVYGNLNYICEYFGTFCVVSASDLQKMIDAKVPANQLAGFMMQIEKKNNVTVLRNAYDHYLTFKGEGLKYEATWDGGTTLWEVRGNVIHYRQKITDGDVRERELMITDSGRDFYKIIFTPINVENIFFTTNIATIVAGTTADIETAVFPSNALDKTLDWTSSDPTIAKVENGTVTALKGGTVTITATSADGSGASASCTLTVEPVLATEIGLDALNYSVRIGESCQPEATVLPSTTTDKDLVWSVKDNSIVDINQETGELVGLKSGTTIITATTKDGSSIKTKALVTVYESSTFDFTQPDKLNPALDAPEEEDNYVNYKEATLSNDHADISFDMGSRTGSYSFRVYSDENLNFFIKAYTNGNITITGKGKNTLSGIRFIGDLINLLPDSGEIVDGVWIGNAESVTFKVQTANTIKSIIVEHAPKSSATIEDDDLDMSADVNKDGRISILDVTKVVNTLLKSSANDDSVK